MTISFERRSISSCRQLEVRDKECRDWGSLECGTLGEVNVAHSLSAT